MESGGKTSSFDQDHAPDLIGSNSKICSVLSFLTFSERIDSLIGQIVVLIPLAKFPSKIDQRIFTPFDEMVFSNWKTWIISVCSYGASLQFKECLGEKGCI